MGERRGACRLPASFDHRPALVIEVRLGALDPHPVRRAFSLHRLPRWATSPHSLVHSRSWAHLASTAEPARRFPHLCDRETRAPSCRLPQARARAPPAPIGDNPRAWCRTRSKPLPA